MNILISNDDGINSNGLKVLAEKLSCIADIYVVAPDCERSGNSHHITLKGKMRIEEKKLPGVKKAYALWGKPADCVHAGIRHFFKGKIDLVVTGINIGANIGSDISYSGTAAAAREAFIHKIPSIALSVDTFNKDIDFSDTADIAIDIVKRYMEDENKDKYYLNVNIPYLPKKDIKGYRITKANATMKYDDTYKEIEEFGVKYLDFEFLDLQPDSILKDIDEDTGALEKGYISISPLDNNHVCREYYEGVKEKWQK